LRCPVLCKSIDTHGIWKYVEQQHPVTSKERDMMILDRMKNWRQSKTTEYFLEKLHEFNIVNHYANSEQKLNQHGWREKLQREYDEISHKLDHYSSSRWRIATFFVMLSFGIFGYSLKESSALGSVLAVLIYWLSFLLFRRFKRLTYVLRAYHIRLGQLLGYHSPVFAMEEMTGTKTTKLLAGFGAVYSLFAVFAYLLQSHVPPTSVFVCIPEISP